MQTNGDTDQLDYSRIHEIKSLDDLQGEEWRDISGYEGYYKVSNLGRIKTCAREVRRGRSYGLNQVKEAIRSTYNLRGYRRMNLMKGESYLVHRHVAESFVPNPGNKKFVNHKNGIKSDNRADNLEWVSHKENVLHSITTGLRTIFPKGSSHGMAILNEQIVSAIKDQIRQGEKTITDIAKDFGVSISTISAIKHKRLWSHV